MTHTIRRILAALLAGFLALAAFAPAGTVPAAAREHPLPKSSATHPAGPNIRKVSNAEGRKAVEYWTERRMANATPMDMRTLDRRGASPSTSPSSLRLAAAPTAQLWLRPNTSAPARMIGKLFYKAWSPSRQAFQPYVCSATVVAAENRSTVWTAGHCVYETFSNRWSKDYVFCPGYKDMNGIPAQDVDCPLGKWRVRYMATTRPWIKAICTARGDTCSESEFNHDFGALVMRPLNGLPIGQRVGSHLLRFHVGTAYHYTFGYPSAAPFAGRRLYVCTSRNVLQRTHLAQRCSMTPGSSGGPYLAILNRASGRGYVDSVISHRSAPGVLHGPYQGPSALGLYNFVRRR